MVDLEKFKKIIREELNVDLFSYKEEQLHRRLKSFFIRNNIGDLEEYAKVLSSNITEREKFLDFVTINVTEFYRNPELYKSLSDILKERAKQNLKIWSAACSNGAEPYSLAIMLNELGFSGYNIYGTDLDPNVIRKAKEGIYESLDIKNLPEKLILKYFTKIGDTYHLSNSIKKTVKFKVHDLLMDGFDDEYDLILCRNVVIYFNSEAKERLYKKLSKSLKPDGLFFVGATENIHEYNNYNFEKVSSFIYKKIIR